MVGQFDSDLMPTPQWDSRGISLWEEVVCGQPYPPSAGHFLTREKDKYSHAVVSEQKRKGHVHTNNPEPGPQLV